MSIIHHPVNPLSEWLSDQSINDIDDVLSWELLSFLSLHRKSHHYLGIVRREIVEPFYLEAFILRHIQVFDLLAWDFLSFASHNVTHVPYCHS